MDESSYQKLADAELDKIVTDIELLDKDTILEVDLLDGVISIILPNNKQYVINKHNVTKKIWVSSPFSSASYFEYKDSKWLNDQNKTLDSMIKEEISNFLSSNV